MTSNWLEDPLIMARFWSKVDVRRPGVCWPWRAATNEHGYGLIRIGGGVGLVKAHRAAWALLNGLSVPDPDLVVRHSCDNPPCCNPAHLSLGTQAENVEDMVQRGRQCRGEDRSTRLTESDVAELRELAAAGQSYAEIAERYRIAPSSVSVIASGERWAHAPGPITRVSERTHCKRRGHEMTAENTYTTSKGHRKCRACIRISQAKYEQKRTAIHV